MSSYTKVQLKHMILSEMKSYENSQKRSHISNYYKTKHAFNPEHKCGSDRHPYIVMHDVNHFPLNTYNGR